MRLTYHLLSTHQKNVMPPPAFCILIFFWLLDMPSWNHAPDGTNLFQDPSLRPLEGLVETIFWMLRSCIRLLLYIDGAPYKLHPVHITTIGGWHSDAYRYALSTSNEEATHICIDRSRAPVMYHQHEALLTRNNV